MFVLHITQVGFAQTASLGVLVVPSLSLPFLSFLVLCFALICLLVLPFPFLSLPFPSCLFLPLSTTLYNET